MPDLTARITEILRRELFYDGRRGRVFKYSEAYVVEGEDAYIGRLAPEVAALLAAAAEEQYRPKIETVEQLDALPDRSIIRDGDGDALQKDTDSHLADLYGDWVGAGSEIPCASDAVRLPAAVVWSPGAGG